MKEVIGIIAVLILFWALFWLIAAIPYVFA